MYPSLYRSFCLYLSFLIVSVCFISSVGFVVFSYSLHPTLLSHVSKPLYRSLSLSLSLSPPPPSLYPCVLLSLSFCVSPFSVTYTDICLVPAVHHYRFVPGARSEMYVKSSCLLPISPFLPLSLVFSLSLSLSLSLHLSFSSSLCLLLHPSLLFIALSSLLSRSLFLFLYFFHLSSSELLWLLAV